jgi:hypothetical protein
MTPALLLILISALAQDATRTGLDEADVRNWTPDTNATWGNPEWRRFGDDKIRDDRFMATDYGPIYGATIAMHANNGKELGRAHKGLGIRLGGRNDMPKAMLVYDRNLLSCQSGWIGGWTTHSNERFGLMDVHGEAAPVQFVMPAKQVWLRPDEEPAERESWCFPLPEEDGRFEAIHLRNQDVILEYTVHGTRVLEHPALEFIDGDWRLVRHVEVAPDNEDLVLRVADLDGGKFAAVSGDVVLSLDQKRYTATIKAGAQPRRFKIVHAVNPDSPPDLGSTRDLNALLASTGALRWPESITTSVETVGTAGPYVHERIVPPFDNPWKSLMFLGGLDFMPNGDPIVSTLFGDVWVVSDIDTTTPSWKRFATGLYQPLGIKVIDGEIFVIERGQLTQLIDHNNDGEADEYRNINNRWHTPGDAHCYDINLETDPDGNWFFVKNGAWHTPTGGCILKVNADGSGDAQVWATGFRHCNSLGMSPTGQLASGGQQGTWQPATRLDLNRQGGFYGLKDAAHNDDVDIYDRPLLWMPLECDNSAGDPVFTPEGWGPLGGELLHLSWGQCWVLHILQEEVDGMAQGAAVVLPWGRCMAGPSRGRFSPVDGDLYIAGSMGWQTWGPWDGCLDRIRYTGDDTHLPTPAAVQTLSDGFELFFTEPLAADIELQLRHFEILQWNYYWSSNYGSAHWRTTGWMEEGQDIIPVQGATFIASTNSIRLLVPELRPAMQTRIGYSVKAASGAWLEGLLWATTHRVPVDDDTVLQFEDVRDRVFANADIELVWRGPLDDTEVLVRAVPTEEGHPEGLGIPIAVDGEGEHMLRIRMRDRRVVAELDGTVIMDHFETDTRVPVAGTLHVLSDDLTENRVLRFTVRPVSDSPSGDREPGARLAPSSEPAL